jgi:WD40 repeat protein
VIALDQPDKSRTIKWPDSTFRDVVGSTPIRTVAVSPDGNWALVTPVRGDSREALLLDVTCASERRRGCTASYRLQRRDFAGSERSQMGFSPDSRVLAFSLSTTGVTVYPVPERGAAAPQYLSSSRSLEFGGPFQIMGFAPVSNELIVSTGVGGVAGEIVAAPLGPALGSDKFSQDLEPNGYISAVREAHHGAFFVGATTGGLVVWARRPDPGFTFVQGRSASKTVTQPTDMAVAPDESWIATAHRDGDVVVWRLDDQTRAGTIAGRGKGHVFIAWATTPAGPTLYIASADGSLSRWTPGTTSLNRLTPSPLRSITSLTVSADGRTAMTTAQDAVAVWRDGTWSTMALGTHPIVALAKSGKSLAVPHESGMAVVDVQRQGRPIILEPPVKAWATIQSVQFSLSDTRVVGVDEFGGVAVWDAQSGRLFANSDAAMAAKVAPLPRQRVFVGYREGNIEVVDVSDGQYVARIPTSGDFNAPPGTLSFDVLQASGLAAASLGWWLQGDPNALFVWKLATGKPLAFVKRQSAPFRRLQFIDSRRTLLMVSDFGVPATLPLDVETQLQALCPLLLAEVPSGVDPPTSPPFCSETARRLLNGVPRVVAPAEFVISGDLPEPR